MKKDFFRAKFYQRAKKLINTIFWKMGRRGRGKSSEVASFCWVARKQCQERQNRRTANGEVPYNLSALRGRRKGRRGYLQTKGPRRDACNDAVTGVSDAAWGEKEAREKCRFRKKKEGRK